MSYLEEELFRFIKDLFTLDSNKVLKFLFASIIFVGILGNMLNIYVYSKQSMRKTLTFRFLLGLSLTDFIILLLCGLESFIEYKYNFDIRAFSVVACKLDTFLAYFLTQTRNFLSMGITMERAKILSSLQKPPNKKSARLKFLASSEDTMNTVDTNPDTFSSITNMHSSPSRHVESMFSYRAHTLARSILSLPKTTMYNLEQVIYGFIIGLFVMNSHFILFLRVNEGLKAALRRPQKANYSRTINTSISSLYEISEETKHLYEFSECTSDYGSYYEKFLENVWFWVDIGIYFLIPFFTMSIAFFVIKFKITKINANYNNFLVDSHYNYNKNNYLKKIRKNNKIIYLLLLINMFFFVTILPFFVFSIFKEKSTYMGDSDYVLYKSFVEILFYANNAFNVFFYGVTSKKYRQEVRKSMRM